MPQLFFISKTLALTINSQQIKRFGGTQGIRDETLLESALGAARQTWHYSGDIFQTAAQYCYSLAVFGWQQASRRGLHAGFSGRQS